MQRRHIFIYMIILYVVFFLTLDFLLPIFFPRYGYYFSYFPIFFFFPFFWFGRRNYSQPKPTAAGDDNDHDDDQEYEYSYVNENMDEYGMPRRRNDSMIFYILGILVIIIAVAVLILKF